MAEIKCIFICLVYLIEHVFLESNMSNEMPTIPPSSLENTYSSNSGNLEVKSNNEMPTRPPSFLEKSELSDEKRLIHDLLEKYERLGRDGRPVKNASEPVTVEFGLGLIKMELHEKENVLSLSTWARYRWRDDYLTWNPGDYGGVISVKMSHEKIWIPDVMLYNTANTDESERKVMAVVMYDGAVTWYPHKVFQSSCAIDVRDFPFDNQTCHMWFGSWTHTLAEVDVNLAFPGGIDLSTFKTVYKDVSEWDIYNHTADRTVMPEGASPHEGYAILSFTLSLRRKMMFSTYILTMPAVFLAFLTLLVFWLPPEHADKSALGLTIFGSLLLLLLILVEAAPPTASAVPLLGLYYCFTTVIVIVSIFLSSVVVKIGRSSESRRTMPKWLRIFMLERVGRAVCLRYSSPCSKSCFGRRCSTSRAESAALEQEAQCRELLARLTNKDERTTEFIEDLRQNGTGTPSALLTIEKRLRYMQDLVNTLVSKRYEKESIDLRDKEIERQWRHLALVLDRIFFFMYLVIIITSLVIFFPRGQD